LPAAERAIQKYSYMTNTYYVYILASKKNGTLYVGVTNNLKRWTRKWKVELIEKDNSDWRDLAEDFAQDN